jgi:pimeloyl-ACP methyl ester carboxylesterase
LPIFAVVGCCLIVLAVAAFIHFQQHSLIYHPRPYGPAYAHVLPPNGVEIEYMLPFGKQTAFFIPPPNDSPKRIWVAFCGNGSLALDWTGLLPGYPPNGDAFLLVDYPGYGRNSGYATIDSTRATAAGALHALADRLHVNEAELTLCVIGHSLGSAAALDFAVHHPVQRVVIVAPLPVCATKQLPSLANSSPACSERTTTTGKTSARFSNAIRRCGSIFITAGPTMTFRCRWDARSQKSFPQSAITKLAAPII